MSFVAMGGANATSSNCALAQITPDNTLGAESSVVTPNIDIKGVPSVRIDGGAIRGANLFHSFREFNINEGRGAYFTNPAGIANILSRVTGTNLSNIFGTLGVTGGNANLFLINPNGMIFGPNARLDLNGSFVGSTASAVNFADGVQFSATAPQATPLLTVSVPIGLQYGGNAGRIVNQSRVTDSSGATVGLAVQPGKSLALVGGDVRLDGGNVFAPGGRVELGGVAGAGTIGLNVDSSNLSLSFPTGVARADVLLTNGSEVNVRAFGGGSIAINSRNLDVLGGSNVRAGIQSELGSPLSKAGNIDINATGTITLANVSLISNAVIPEGVGDSGDINVTAALLSLTDGSRISTSTFGQGNAGNVNIDVRDAFRIAGVSNGFSSGIFSDTDYGAVGHGGNITIQAGEVVVENTETGISSVIYGKGDTGDITINTRNLIVTNAQILSDVVGEGNVGTFKVIASDSVELNGEIPGNEKGFPGGILAQVDSTGKGKGGNLSIETRRLSLSDGSKVQAANFGQGDAGSLFIRADEIDVFNTERPTYYLTGIFAGVQLDPRTVNLPKGRGGDLTIETRTLSIRNGGSIRVDTQGKGTGGRLVIKASDSVEVTGNSPYASQISADVTNTGIGNGGSITIETPRLSVADGGIISTSSQGVGNAGDIAINAGFVGIDKGQITAQTVSGGGGNINFDLSQYLLLRNNSLISTTAGTAQASGDGGNITINTPFIVAVPSEDSDIRANAFTGNGGQVTITASGIFGTQFRKQQTSESDITSSSTFGLSGTVQINTPDLDPEQGLVTLPAELADASNQIASGTCPAGGENKFTIAGRGGLPPNPREPLSGEAVLTNWATLSRAENTEQGQRSRETNATNSVSSAPTQIVEATGWMVNDKGEVVLTAAAPTDTLNIPWLPESGCHALKSSS